MSKYLQIHRAASYILIMFTWVQTISTELRYHTYLNYVFYI